MLKQTKNVEIVIPALLPAARAIGAAYKKQETAQQAIAKAVTEAAGKLRADQVETFVAMTKAEISKYAAPASVKVETTRIRRVLSEIVAGNYTPEGTESLRRMYEACKGGATSRQSAPRTVKKPESSTGSGEVSEVTVSATPKQKADAAKVAITTLFGFYTPELATAVAYAVKNSGPFTRWADANVKAAQLTEMENLAKKPAAKQTPAKKVPAKKATRRKAA